MADRPEDVTCRRCRNSKRYQDVVAEQAEREAARRVDRQARAVAVLIERHRAEYEELLEAEAVIDVLGN